MNLILIAGGTGSGKSNFTNTHLLKNDVRKKPGTSLDLYSQSNKSKRQYIFDINNEYEFNTDNSNVIHPCMRHVECDMNKFVWKCKQLKNTNIVFEDSTGFLRGKQSAEFARLIVQKRHSNNNYILIFHSVYRFPPELVEYMNHIFIFRTNDDTDNLKNKFEDKRLVEAVGKLRTMPKYSNIHLTPA